MQEPRDVGHPSGLKFLFFTELWERFGYYLMIGILWLYMNDTHGLNYQKPQADSIFSTFIALVYLTPFMGGLLADKLLGYRRSIIIGCILMAAGYICLAIPDEFSFYLSLGLIIIGTGFFKPNISTLLGNLYNDPRFRSKKDIGFNIFYMGINVGAFICNFVAAYMRNNWGWGSAFIAAGIGMLVGLGVFVLGTRHYAHVDKVDQSKAEGNSNVLRSLASILVPAAIFGTIGWMIKGNDGNIFGSNDTDAFLFACIPIIVFFILLLRNAPKAEKAPIKALLSIMAVCVIFWAIFKQNGTALTNWAKNYTDRSVENPTAIRTLDKLGWVERDTVKIKQVKDYDAQFRTHKGPDGKTAATRMDYPSYLNNLPKEQWPKENATFFTVNTELFQSINPFFIILLTPVVVSLFRVLRRRGKEPSTASKIFFGLIITSLSCFVMVGAVMYSDNGLIKSSAGWLMGTYFIITFGELFLSPMGLSLVSKLSPPRIAALMMGAWSLSTSIGNKLSGVLASLWDGFEHKEYYFYMNSGLTLVAALGILAMLPWLRRVIKEHVQE